MRDQSEKRGVVISKSEKSSNLVDLLSICVRPNLLNSWSIPSIEEIVLVGEIEKVHLVRKLQVVQVQGMQKIKFGGYPHTCVYNVYLHSFID